MNEKKTCRTCLHRERWECGSKIIQYCRKLKSTRTFNGLKKIKCNQEACMYYERDTEKEMKPKKIVRNCWEYGGFTILKSDCFVDFPFIVYDSEGFSLEALNSLEEAVKYIDSLKNE